jgi:hypothetical protein
LYFWGIYELDFSEDALVKALGILVFLRTSHYFHHSSKGRRKVFMATMPTKADTSWAQRWFSEKYEPWSREVQPLIEAHQYGIAFKTYPFLGFDQTPWSPVRIPLEDVRLGVVSTAGLYRRDVDSPFTDAPYGEGDSRVIELPRGVSGQSLATAHSHIPHDLIEADVNVALPLDPSQGVRTGRTNWRDCPSNF